MNKWEEDLTAAEKWCKFLLYADDCERQTDKDLRECDYLSIKRYEEKITQEFVAKDRALAESYAVIEERKHFLASQKSAFNPLCNV